jgi:hypothetical protein
MTIQTAQPAHRSRWLNWKPETAILDKHARSEPSKPSKPSEPEVLSVLMVTNKTIKTGLDGFDGPYPGEIPKIDVEPDPAELAGATALLNRAGVRLMRLETGYAVGVWSDLDSPAVRHAVRLVGAGEWPVRYLDGDVPLRYKLRRVPGQPVPADVRVKMEASAEPWSVRNRMFHGFIPWRLAAFDGWEESPH